MAKYNSVSELYADVQTYVNINESTFVAQIPMWVYQAETELDRRLRHPAAEIVSIYTLLAGDYQLPAPKELLELKSILSRKTGEMLYRRSYETLSQTYNNSKYPIVFASVANYFYLDKIADEDIVYEIIFYVTPDKLNINTNPDNFYLAVLPDFLLYVALEQAYIFEGMPDQAQYWRVMAETQLALLNEQIKREAYQGSTLVSWNDEERNNFYY